MRPQRSEPPRRSDAPQDRGSASRGKETWWRAAMALEHSPATFNKRVRLVIVIIFILVIAMVLRLAWVQIIAGEKLSMQAQAQRTATIADPAHRGKIVDRNGQVLAYTMEARSLSVHPNKLRGWMQEHHEQNPDEVLPPDQRIDQIAEELPKLISKDGDDIEPQEIKDKLTSDETYVVLVRNVDPDIAAHVVEKFPEITSERQDIRQYPNGAVGSNFIGKISTDNQGQFGLELSQDSKLQGINGSRTVDIAGDGYLIPGSTRDQHPAVDGDQYNLTIDVDAQTFIQQQVQQAREKSGAKSVSAVVLDSQSGKILSLASSDTINPNGDVEKQLKQKKVFGDRNTADSFEPGSVAKIMTAAAAVEDKKTRPDEVLKVPGSIEMSGVTVRDAWQHGDLPLTTTGVFGKSSNVGTLMLAQRVGEDKMYDYFRKFGVGQAPGVGLPYETAGYMPDRNQWSGGTFANLPIGQGMSMNLLQMASIYQALANGGERIEPRLIEKTIKADGTEIPGTEPKRTQVVSPKTARTVIDMFRAVTQSDPTGVQQGTGSSGAIKGYQTSGKTGTAQQVDPKTGSYSNSNYWITFAGIAPADDPRFVVALMMDDPQRGPDGGAGGSAAPLFSDIGSWLLDHYNVPPSPTEGPKLMLEARN